MDEAYIHSSLILWIAFFVSGFAVWFTGIKLSKVVDHIDQRLSIGQALGGMIFLAIVTNLPEVAIVLSASVMNNIKMAVGNILGGIAIQTAVLAFLDAVALKNKGPLTLLAASSQLITEGILLIAILAIVIMASFLPSSLILFRIAPSDVLIVAIWFLSLFLVNKFQKKNSQKNQQKIKQSNTQLIVIFSILSLVTLFGGIILEESSRMLAKSYHISGALFGATLLAAITALPEVSTGYSAIKLQDYNLAISDIFGGNAFLPVLFFLATLITGQSTLPSITASDIFLTSLGILLTAIYIIGLTFRSKKQVFWLGIDSLMVIITYIIGIIGLFYITK